MDDQRGVSKLVKFCHSSDLTGECTYFFHISNGNLFLYSTEPAQGVLGASWDEGLFIFRELGALLNTLRELGSKHILWGI